MISEAGSETVIVRNPNSKIVSNNLDDESCADNEFEEADDASANFVPETKISCQMAKVTANELHESPNPGSKIQTL